MQFVDNGTNGHQKKAADQFIRSGQTTAVITLPHAVRELFTATFSVAQVFPSGSTSDIYMYVPLGGRPVEFRYCLPGFPEHMARRAAYWLS
jgi:hypothetical protein